MNKILAKMFLMSVYIFFLLGVVQPVQAETLPPGFLVGDDTGFKAGTDGEYFIVNNNIEPGRGFTREISISNYSNSGDSFSIKLVMNPEDDINKSIVQGKINLLEAIHVKLTYKDKIVYQGPIDGNGSPVANKKSNPIDLGTLETGESQTIHAEFTVNNEYPAEDWKNVNYTDFYWLFYANKSPTTNSSDPSRKSVGRLPNTGESIVNILLLLLSVLILIVMACIYKNKKKE